MNLDSHYMIGDGHEVCQDYATHNVITDGLIKGIESKEMSPFVMPVKMNVVDERKIIHNPDYDMNVFENLIVKTDSRLKAVAIFSDGIKSFRDDNERKNIDYLEVVKELMNFKSYNGNFAKRRLKRYVKQCRENNISHFDDVSMACMCLGE